MTGPVSFRVLFGGEDDARKLTVASGMPKSVDELAREITTYFGLTEQVRLQYRDVEFGNEFLNLSSISDIQDRSTLKVIYFPCESTSSVMSLASLTEDTCFTFPVTLSSFSSQEPNDSSSVDSSSTNETVILSSPESRSCTWPEVFVVPRFSYCAEMQLQKGNSDFSVNGTVLSLTPKIRSDILEGLAEEIIKYTAYPRDDQFEKVAEALIQTHPCLHEKGTPTGYSGWKHYIKIKMMNFRTKLGRAGHPEVTVNSLKHKQKGQGKPAANIKKPRKAEVNFCPNHPRGETPNSLEAERAAILTEVKKQNNETVIKEKMHRTFSYRRQEILQEPMITEVRNRCPALFQVGEINLEFMRITTVPLTSKFIGQLDKYTDDLLKVFLHKGGTAGQKIGRIMALTAENEDINIKQDCILRSLSVYLNEDLETLVKEFVFRG
ncbi:uncharacterized protein Hap1MRO34_014856 isoform 2-T3 [Clarias gariepinus]|uniref:uncharacterized protein LOC128534594 isoform X2 n=1 Tax=Clarias gariepinus TaxID=13013 RepID=UPI00234C8A99|nr:uncharacterized protein LOC128534594 isoform X2 [Clarias gariepinus]